jgi:hypothetical protein
MYKNRVLRIYGLHMKKPLLILVLFILTYLFSQGQTTVYHPFPDSDAIWVGLSWHGDLGAPCTIFDEYNLYISGDTAIGPYTYHKLYKNSYKWSSCPPPPGYYEYGQYCGAFRQDIVNKKVYLSQLGVDTLAYDFNLEAGDTLVSCLGGLPDYYIESTDSILVDGEYRKVLWINCGEFYHLTALIEGIGTYSGAFEPLVYNWGEFGNDLYCVRIDNQIAISLMQQNECSLLSLNENQKTENNILIAPNPFSQATTIKTDRNLVNATLIVYNFLGQQVKVIHHISGKSILLEREKLPNGLYYFYLSQESKTISVEKLIITD